MNLEKLEFEKHIEQISTLYREKKYSQLKSILADINPTDIAVLFDEFPNEQRILLFRLLPKEEAAETFVELDGERRRLSSMLFQIQSFVRLLTSFTLMIQLILLRKCLQQL